MSKIDKWLRANFEKDAGRSENRAVGASVIAISISMLVGAVTVDYITDIRYNPLILYVGVVLYVSWKAPTRYATIFVVFTMIGMAFAAMMNSSFYTDIVPAFDLFTTMLTIALLSYALVRFKAATLKLLESQRSQLEDQQQRNEQQRTFVAALSHEFRTPLNVIAGHAQRLSATRDTISPNKISERTDSILNSAKIIQRLVDSILLSERLAQSQVEASISLFDFAEMVRRCCQRHMDSNPECAITVSFAEAPSIIAADELLIEHALDNLLSNAIKYSPKPAGVDVVGIGETDYVRIVVHDCGRGISQDEIPRIFDRYYRSASVGRVSGFGIGLYIVRNIVHLHNGTIDVQSIPGSGTTFTMRLPDVLRAGRRGATP